MWHYDNEEDVLYMYIKTLMDQVAKIFRLNFIQNIEELEFIPIIQKSCSVWYYVYRDSSIGDSIDIDVTKIVHLKNYEEDVDNRNSTAFDFSHYLKVVPEANDLLKEFCDWQNRNRFQINNMSNVDILFHNHGMYKVKWCPSLPISNTSYD